MTSSVACISMPLANAYSCLVMMYVQPYLCRIAEAAGTCPVCRRNMKKVRKIFTV